jgi:hypothetical protein
MSEYRERALSQKERKAIGMPSGVLLRQYAKGGITLVLGAKKGLEGRDIGMTKHQEAVLRTLWADEVGI